jgi:hypothetical protein
LRIWSIHPKYLDPQGLVALWREGLLAQAVLLGKTRGYRAHPQLARFSEQRSPVLAIGCYLAAVQAEATQRGYRFDRERIATTRKHRSILVSAGQLEYEWAHLMRKLKERQPELHRQWRGVDVPEVHPLFEVREGGLEDWERPQKKRAARRRLEGRDGGVFASIAGSESACEVFAHGGRVAGLREVRGAAVFGDQCVRFVAVGEEFSGDLRARRVRREHGLHMGAGVRVARAQRATGDGGDGFSLHIGAGAGALHLQRELAGRVGILGVNGAGESGDGGEGEE